ncbi:MAG: Dabb family protein [Bacteroidota bacterium]
MKKIILALFVLISGLSYGQTSSGDLRHVVIFKFKETSSKASVDSVVKSFMGLAKKIPVIKSIEWGLNDSPENFHQGFTHCFVITFSNKKDRDEVYQKHPAHMEFQKVLGPHMEKVFVVDYKAEN